MKKSKFNTRRIVSLSLMAAITVGLHYLEHVIPPLVPVPGFRLGLSNLVTLFVLFYYGGPSYIFVTLIKLLMVPLIATGFGPQFYLSLGGTLTSMVVSLLLYYLVKPSMYGLSIPSALAHTLGQLIAFAIYIGNFQIFIYLVVLGPLSFATGTIIALIDTMLMKRIPSSFLREEKIRR
mgnify:CR=1 FL=1|jgi:hypothetical protein